MATRLIGMTMTLLIAAGISSGDDKKKGASKDDTMAAMMKMAEPGEHHKVLGLFAGKWTYTGTWHMPGGVAMPISGGSESEVIMGGRYVTERVWSEDDGKSFQGRGVMCYDNVKKKYCGGWIDTMGTGITVTEGSWDAKTKTMTMNYETVDPTSGQKVKMKDVAIVKGDTIEKHMFAIADGKEVKAMEMTYKRAK